MALKNPLGTVKDVVGTVLKAPATVVGTAVGLAKGAVGVGAHAVTAATGHTGGHSGTAPAEGPQTEAATVEGSPSLGHPISPDEPVNVTEELGLDPSPVATPRKPRKPAEKPVTGIDAAADPADVDVTPADVAKTVQQDGPTG
ncbi:MAG TPA: hypothetical protein VNT31_10995 [Nocardioides sp.]|nr:hypothetical protein [Nocardioides sp.]